MTGELNVDGCSDRRCPICHKVLKSPQGATDHMIGAHGMTRPEAKAARKKYRHKVGGWERAQSARQGDDDFDLVDESDAF